MAAATVLALVLAASTPAAPESDSKIEYAMEACPGLASPDAVIDARSFTSAAELVTVIANRREGRVAVIGGDFSDEDMRPLANPGQVACYIESDLSRTDWRGGEATGTRFIAAKLTGAQMAQSGLDATVFEGVDLSGADLSEASLTGALWQGANWTSNLEGTVFRDAVMEGFRFRCGITMDESCGGSGGADFGGADLTRADLASFPVWGYDSFAGARFADTRIGPRAVRHLGEGVIDGDVVLASGWFEEDGWPDNTVRLTREEFLRLRDAALTVEDDRPSFECAKAGNTAERVICGEYESQLRALDRELSEAFTSLRESGKVTLESQRAWLRSRNACTDRDCIEQAYETRLEQLYGALGTRFVLAPDASVTFEEDLLPLPADFRATELYRRIVPTLRAASYQSITLTGREDGTLAGEGEALGGNAHTCTFGVDGAVYDRATGWYAGVADDGTKVPLFRVRNGRITLRYSGNMGDTPDEAQNFISCGARAAFTDLRNLEE
ncbi:pentapeptide repeat-containing protein [Parerythrobacter lacustris]|uniref:Pentapeptide repeat-containing protein n=1 Tax=Parerythrobacter lacustris TaxID=2969984 RepID=A0ABT1XV41_9SPHN|nr:pentapeptide repeat-containing protein [Parerythrobacter lacustris]MCR2834796.1 pentapeptide repeat-containing protein [Parerythrobacter lacustris]